MLSKYEHGLVSSVPVGVIETCMHLVNISLSAPDAEMIAGRIVSQLGGDDHVAARKTINQFLDCIEELTAEVR